MTKLEFSGSLEEVKSEIEQAIATYELLGNRSSINFENWFEKWEQGFPTAIENRPLGNYQLSGEKIWRSDSSKRPRWRQWSNEGGIITGEYWPDRSVEADSILLSGTSIQLINHIIQIQYEAGGSAQARKSKGGSEPELKGLPLIRLYFAEDERSNSKSLRTGEITFRIRKTEDPDPTIPLTKISKSDLITYATKIRDLFGVNGGYVWDKGKLVASYRSRYQGFEGWYLVRTKSDGENLIRKLLAVTDQPFYSSGLKFSESANPSEAFPESPETILVLGEPVQRPQRRPNVSVRFQRAEIELSLLPNPIPLVEGDRIVYA